MKKATGIFGLCLVLTGLFWIAEAGSLEPAAPPAPTMKTLEAIEPRTPISAPGFIPASGSYYLTADITGGTIIIFQLDDVTLDLNGFSIGSHVSAINIGQSNNVVIRNGTLRELSSTALAVDTSTAVQFVDLQIRDSGGGISIDLSSRVSVRNCLISNMVFHAISVTNGSWAEVTGNTLSDSLQGVVLKSGASAVISHNTLDNTALGIDLGVASVKSTVTGNTITGSSTVGISVSGDSEGDILGNTVTGGFRGIRVVNTVGAGTVVDNRCLDNTGIGIDVDAANFWVARNLAARNGGGNYDLTGGVTAAPVVSIIASPTGWANVED
jgi:parallel beta-helix repeat protein